MIQQEPFISAKKIKEMDNKLTYAIGYRNLFNIVVLACGVVGILATQWGTTQNWVALTIFILGGKWMLTRMQENIDTLAVSEI